MTAPENSGELQFEEVATRTGEDAAAAAIEHACTVCRRRFDLEYFDVNGRHVCRACSETVASFAATPRGLGPWARAAGAGVVAALLGAVLYYAVLAISGFEVGLVAIAIGYMVGYGVQLGTRGRGGRRFQVLALVLTYWAIGLGYSSLAFQQLLKPSGTTGAPTTASATRTSGAVQPTDAATPAPIAQDEERRTTGAGFALGLAILLGFTFVLPVIMIAGSMPGGLISGAIIVFGMLQAWKMTAAPAVTVTGPYRIGATPAAG